jgi:hypothetical protein
MAGFTNLVAITVTNADENRTLLNETADVLKN